MDLLTQGDYRIGVTGSRNWYREGPIRRALRFTAQEGQVAGLRPVLVVGDCPTGADWIAAKLWRGWQWEPEVHYAKWDLCGPGCPSKPHRVKRWPEDKHHPGTLEDWCPHAGPRRNRALVRSGLDVLLAFPMGDRERSGTRNCISRAEEAGVPVVYPPRWE